METTAGCAPALNANLNARLNDPLNKQEKFSGTPVFAPT